ncbi:MAG: helix-hairpin-helix domain-containing protein [Marinilabiliales bacterium]
MNKRFVLILISIFFPLLVFSQDPKSSEAIEELIEMIASSMEDEDVDYSTLTDDLYNFLENPINLNETSAEELEKLVILTDYQINNLLFYREKNGEILSIYELLLIDGFSKELVEKLMPFFTLESRENKNIIPKKMWQYGSHQIFIRMQQVLEEQKGFSDITDSAYAENYNSRYLGSKQKIYTRYKYNYKNKIYWGITAEKDAGELFFKSNLHDSLKNDLDPYLKNGFDYNSAHFQINNVKFVKTFVAGDYQLRLGQGLTAWSGMTYNKSPYVLNIKKVRQGLQRYASTDENNFLRGVGTTLRFKNIDFTVFYSRKKIDANIADYDTLADEAVYFTSIQSTGLHSIPSEVVDKDAISEEIMGGSIVFNHKYFKTGFNLLNYQFDGVLNKDPKPYNQFEFQGTDNYNASVDYQINYKNFSIFGEAAMSQNNRYAFLNGIILQLHSQFSLSVLHRYFDKEYQALYADAFSEGTKVNNEEGLYFGFEYYPIKKWKISGYVDRFHYEWLRNRVDAPSNGYEYFIQAYYNFSRHVKMYWRLKQEIKQQNEATEDDVYIPELLNVNTVKIRYHISYEISDQLTLRNRLELSRYNKVDTVTDYGYLIYQDIIYKPEKLPLSLAFRYAIFETDSWDSRIYAYENDVLYGYSIPAFYMKGNRTYLTLKYTITKNIDVWLRYARTFYANMDIIGSGLTEIDGNTKSEVKFQVRFRF